MPVAFTAMTGDMAPWPLLATGRDSEIFDIGGGRVLRRPRRPRPMLMEAAVMQHVNDHGYPAPRVHQVGGPDHGLVMERVDGRPMLDTLIPRLWRLSPLAGVLTRLHDDLHRIPAPEWLPNVGPDGDRMIHLDLHPLNVLMTATGPVVIDWANAARGRPELDVALTWVLMATSQIPGAGVTRRLIGGVRTRFVNAFLGHFDRDFVLAGLRPAAEFRLRDANVLPEERQAVERLVLQEEKR